MESTVATMTFVRHYMKIACPSIFAWNDCHNNPVGVPYLIMEKVRGTAMSDLWGEWNDGHRLHALSELACIHAQMMKKIPFKDIGSIFFNESFPDCPLDDQRCYVIKPLVKNKHIDEEGMPYLDWGVATSDNIHDIWSNAHDVLFKTMQERWGGSDTNTGFQSEDENIKEILNDAGVATWNDVVLIAKDLKMLVDNIDIPPNLQRPCLVHADFAFRNIMFYEGGTNGKAIFTIIDWDEAAVLPEVLVTHYPDELETNIHKYVMQPGLAKTSPEKPLIGDWTIFAQPRGRYRSLADRGEGLRIDGELSEFWSLLRESESARFIQIYLQLLFQWDFPDHFLRSDSGPEDGGSEDEIGHDVLLAVLPICADARAIHKLFRNGYLSWIVRKNWIREKARTYCER